MTRERLRGRSTIRSLLESPVFTPVVAQSTLGQFD
jgi:hypothetical protein